MQLQNRMSLYAFILQGYLMEDEELRYRHACPEDAFPACAQSIRISSSDRSLRR